MAKWNYRHGHVQRDILCKSNKLKSLKVAQIKDEMDGNEDDGCAGVCDVVWWCCVVMLCGDGVVDGVGGGMGDVVCDGVDGGEDGGKVEWLILCFQTDGRADRLTDICTSRIAFATEIYKPI